MKALSRRQGGNSSQSRWRRVEATFCSLAFVASVRAEMVVVVEVEDGRRRRGRGLGEAMGWDFFGIMD